MINRYPVYSYVKEKMSNITIYISFVFLLRLYSWVYLCVPPFYINC